MERHLKRTVQDTSSTTALGARACIPEPPQTAVQAGPHRHELPRNNRVIATAVLGGLHHEYSLEKEAA